MASEHRRAERLGILTQVGPDTEMGRLLRLFWHPVAVGRKLAAGTARALRILGEELTLYRGESGKPYLVGGRCAHRLSVLHTGWIEGEQLRCMYHGWKFDGMGQCTERPAERDAVTSSVRIAGYPLVEYCGLIFAYLGPGEAPPFELPRKDVFEDAKAIVYARSEVWPCNWFQLVENSMDSVHVGFVHQKGRVGTFVGTVSMAIPELEYQETGAGIRQTATRGPGNVRVSDWTFPNCNHISQPGLRPGDPWIHVGHWNVPVDDVSTERFNIWATPKSDPETDRRVGDYFVQAGEYSAAAHHDELFYQNAYPLDDVMQLTSAQDYVAQVGQGVCADREHEVLGRSDAGIAFLRRIFLRELDALCEGGPTKSWHKLEVAAELPVQVALHSR
jgi:5,5'-dehydrodivanillate O-demethylase